MKWLSVCLSAAVIINILEPSTPIGCPQAPPALQRLADGSYQRYIPRSMTLQACYSDARRYQELWTDYPEKGGTFINRMEVNK